MVEIDSAELDVEAIRGGEEAAEELEAALQTFAANDTDVILAAEGMPGSSGWAFLEAEGDFMFDNADCLALFSPDPPLPQPVSVEEELPDYDEEAGDVSDWVNNVVAGA